MSNHSPNHASEIATLKELYSALNRNDIPTVMRMMDPQIVRIEFEGTPSGGSYRGLAEMQKHFENGRSTWAEGACTPKDFIVAGDKVIVLVHVRVRLKDRTDWLEGRVADGFAFRDGKITQMNSYHEKSQAMTWAGLPS